MYSYRTLFLKHVAQTSPAPLAIEIIKGRGVWLTDVNKKKYIDFISGIGVSSLGHAHPAVVKAVQKQIRKYAHLMVYGEYVQAPQVRLAELLAKHLPENLNSVYFINSGSEATEVAMKLVKRATGRSKIIGMKNAYHGSTQGSLSLMGDEFFKSAYRPLLPDIHHIRFNNFDDLLEIDKQTAAVFVETIQGEAGAVLPNPLWIQALRKKCTDVGALLVCDEIQAGVGRTGKLWAFEHFNIVPDILLLAKGIGGGLPIGLVIADKKLTDLFSYNPILGHINTFGGNAVSAAAALATFNYVVSEKPYLEIEEKEAFLRSSLKEYPIEISGKGFLLAGHFQSEEQNFAYISKCIENGLITDWFLFNTKAFRMAPPLIISEKDMKTSVKLLKKSFEMLPL